VIRPLAGSAIALAALLLALALSACVPGLPELPTAPQPPAVTVTVTTTVNGEPQVPSGQAGAPAQGDRAGAREVSQGEAGQAGTTVQGSQPPRSGSGMTPDPGRSAAIDRAVQALTPLDDADRAEVCDVMAPLK